MAEVLQELSEFLVAIEPSALPRRIEKRARACLLNGLGIALASRPTPYHQVASQAMLAGNSVDPAGATVLSNGRKLPVGAAVLANAALFHGRAQEDACGAAHFGPIIIPLALALLETRPLPLDRLLPALVAGYEAGGFFEEAYGSMTTAAGFRASCLYGPIAAAATAAKLFGYDVGLTKAALSYAFSFAGGTLNSFATGTDEWRYQIGLAAVHGLHAAELAGAGAKAAADPIGTAAGFLRSYLRQPVAAAASFSAPTATDRWSLDRIAFKPHPVCAYNQTPVEAALKLRRQLAGRPVAKGTIRMHPVEAACPGLDSKGPFRTITDTLMSVQFCVATTLLKGPPFLSHLECFGDPDVLGLASMIEVVAVQDMPSLSCTLRADAGDGPIDIREFRSAADYAWDTDQVMALLARLAEETGFAPSRAVELADFVEGLPGGSIDQAIGCLA